MRIQFNVLCAIAALLISASYAAAEENLRRIAVSGSGSVSVEPDMANITLGVTKQARTAAEAVDLMSVELRLVIDSLMAAGIEESKIQTSHLRVNPEYNYNNSSGGAKLTGYSASSNVTVNVKDLESLPQVLDAVIDNGANEMNGLQFDVSDPAPHLEAARRAAVADARSKALIYADAAGVSVGEVISISEAGAAHNPIMMADMAMSRRESVPVMAGEISIDAQINVIFAIGQ